MPSCLCDSCAGLCCRYFALPIDNPTTARQYDDIRWYLCHENVCVFIEKKQWYIGIANRCKHLQADNRCGIYLTRPAVCREYSTDNCDYHGGEYDFSKLFTSAEQLRVYAEEKLREAAKKRKRKALREKAGAAKGDAGAAKENAGAAKGDAGAAKGDAGAAKANAGAAKGNSGAAKGKPRARPSRGRSAPKVNLSRMRRGPERVSASEAPGENGAGNGNTGRVVALPLLRT